MTLKSETSFERSRLCGMSKKVSQLCHSVKLLFFAVLICAASHTSGQKKTFTFYDLYTLNLVNILQPIV